jgi:phage gp36-like protein
VAFARQQEAARRRDALAEQQIADARGPIETPDLEGPFDDKPDALGDAMRELDAMIDHRYDAPKTVLTGESHGAFAEFCSAARALEAHQKQGGEVLERYKAALQKLSAIAARSGG